MRRRKTAVSSHHIAIWMWALAVYIRVKVFGDTRKQMFLPLLSHIFLFLSTIFIHHLIFNKIMSNEESLLALLQESLGYGQRTNAPIIINNNYFNAPVGQHNDHVESVNFSMGKDGSISYQHIRRTGQETIPLELIMKAVEQTMTQGLWWASTAWAVVYRIYQIMGYAGSIRQFVRDVADWPFERDPEYECNYDAVCKPIRSGKLSGTPDVWASNGATDQYVILGEELLKELEKES